MPKVKKSKSKPPPDDDYGEPRPLYPGGLRPVEGTYILKSTYAPDWIYLGTMVPSARHPTPYHVVSEGLKGKYPPELRNHITPSELELEGFYEDITVKEIQRSINRLLTDPGEREDYELEKSCGQWYRERIHLEVIRGLDPPRLKEKKRLTVARPDLQTLPPQHYIYVFKSKNFPRLKVGLHKSHDGNMYRRLMGKGLYGNIRPVQIWDEVSPEDMELVCYAVTQHPQTELNFHQYMRDRGVEYWGEWYKEGELEEIKAILRHRFDLDLQCPEPHENERNLRVVMEEQAKKYKIVFISAQEAAVPGALRPINEKGQKMIYVNQQCGASVKIFDKEWIQKPLE